MAQKIKVQDGIIVLSAADPTQDIDVTINGILNVSESAWVANELLVGNNAESAGTITTAPNENLIITTGTNGNLNLTPMGILVLQGANWPSSPNATQGSYLGASATNQLKFYPFVYGYNSSDTLTNDQLNTTYPNIQPGQSIVGPTTMYNCISPGQWRILGGGSGSGPSLSIPSTLVPYGNGTDSGVITSPNFNYNDSNGYLSVNAGIQSISGTSLTPMIVTGDGVMLKSIITPNNTPIISTLAVSTGSSAELKFSVIDDTGYVPVSTDLLSVTEQSLTYTTLDPTNGTPYTAMVASNLELYFSDTSGTLLFINQNNTRVYSDLVITANDSTSTKITIGVNGSIKVNDSVGSAGDILTSNGVGNVVSWNAPVITGAPMAINFPAGAMAETMDFGSAGHHNSYNSFASITSAGSASGSTPAPVVTIRADSFWTGTDLYWYNNFNPINPGPMPVGGYADFVQYDSLNPITFIADAGVTINTNLVGMITNGANTNVRLIKIRPNFWWLG